MKIKHHLSDTLLDLPAHRLHEQLTGPSLFLLPGLASRPLFVSILLHGNEYTGWEVIRRLLKKQQSLLPRPLALFIGNVEAARHRARRLDQQPDFNRCWPGAACDNEITQLFQEVYDWAAQQDLLASIDIHNNTGNNPLYSIINRSDAATCQLARDFAPTTVFTRYPR
ncbi:MAG: succinylglutamate desuccinylase/aspartoacylase family protein, partial [Xanthomonadales bacterium]|nr:succinylglutamate desuccinylase/aspartoacylase family protein [Xanthomonadales bacterium]